MKDPDDFLDFWRGLIWVLLFVAPFLAFVFWSISV
jgi:hypothetical protein